MLLMHAGSWPARCKSERGRVAGGGERALPGDRAVLCAAQGAQRVDLLGRTPEKKIEQLQLCLYVLRV